MPEVAVTDVFVSRPTWVADKFRQGLDGFLRVLRGLELNPRTLGATDYPRKSPLDEVISLMDRCAGAIILGYPQIEVDSGRIKGKGLPAPLCLGTEWNHIEAGLAYAKRLPLLVIHHRGVVRGIFDRGAVNSFIYEKDLADPAWPLGEEIAGALRSWKADLFGRSLDGGIESLRGPSNVEQCPRCHETVLHIESSAPDRIFGVLGVSRRVYRCEACGFSEEKHVG